MFSSPRVDASPVSLAGIALKVPRVDMDKCTQCNYCALICPHAAIRAFLFSPDDMAKAPAGIKSGSRAAIGGGALDKFQFRIQVTAPSPKPQSLSCNL